MSRKFYITLAVAFVASSIGLGVVGYKTGVSQSIGYNAVKNYDWVMELTSQYSGIEKTGMDGNYFSAMANEDKAFLIDEYGEKIEEVDYGWIEGEGDKYIFTEKGKMGYKNLRGEILIPARYDYLYKFDGGYAMAQIGDWEFAIDENGRTAYRTAEDEDIWFSHISGKYFGQSKDGKYKVIDVERGKTIKEWDSAYCDDIQCIQPGIYQASGISGRYFLDWDFDVTFDRHIYKGGAVRDFHEGFCYAELITNGTYDDVPDAEQVKKGYIGSDGNIAIETDGSLYGSDFSEGKAVVYGAKEAWVIDNTGKELFRIPMKKNLAITSGEYDALRLQIYILNGSIFQNGMAPIYDGKKMGLVDETGRWVMEPVFDDMDFIGEHLLAVEYHGKWGIIRG